MKLKTVTWDEIRRAKAADRVRDWKRLANGEITPEELQRENSPFPPNFFAKARIVNLSQSLRSFSRHRKTARE